MLRLRRADSFTARLMGVWRYPLLEHEALWLLPCKAVHTIGLRTDLDVLFLDAQTNIVRCVPGLKPNRCAWHWKAYSVVELPGGYCRRHPDCQQALRAALSRATGHVEKGGPDGRM